MIGTAAAMRNSLIDELMRYHAADKTERAFLGPFLTLLDNPRCFYRDCFPGHITGSALLLNVDGEKVLMNHHKTLDKWLSFGGHADGEEDILAVAIRETMEESGITAFKPLSPDFIDIDIHEIPANPLKNEPAHLHYDLRYVMRMTQEQQAIVSHESLSLQWMTHKDALRETSEDEGMNRLLNKAFSK